MKREEKNRSVTEGNRKGAGVVTGEKRWYQKLGKIENSRYAAKASLTVEAALILPVILSIFLFFLSFLQIIRAEQQIYYAASELAEETAACGYVLKYASQEAEALWDSDGKYFEAAEFALDILQGAGDALWFQNAMQKKLVNEGCINAVVEGGVFGIDFWGSEIYAEDELAVVRMEFKVSFPVFRDFLPKISFQKSVVMRSFSGVGDFERDSEGEEDESGEEEGFVFVTETGTVYHVRETCTYIRLGVEQTSGGGIADKRNQYGGKYYPCEVCMKDGVVPEKVWVTKTGTRCHAKKDCSKIKRTVKKLPVSEASGYRPCSRCAKED